MMRILNPPKLLSLHSSQRWLKMLQMIRRIFMIRRIMHMNQLKRSIYHNRQTHNQFTQLLSPLLI